MSNPRRRFEALHCGERLRIINPLADVGVVTLWSTVKSVVRRLQQEGIDLNADTSRIAVIANLYGNGLPQMLRNLLWNPQIQFLMVLGQDLSGSKTDLSHFFKSGLEEVDFLGTRMHRIIGTKRIIDGDVRPEHFNRPISITMLGLLSDPETRQGLRDFFDRLPPRSRGGKQKRKKIPIPTVAVQRFPSEARSHTIVRETPLDAWEELIFRLHRFGHHNKVAKRSQDGKPYNQKRIELQNVLIVIQDPKEDPAEHLEAHQFSLESFHIYQQRMLEAHKPDDQSYTYGNRLRGYFRYDDRLVDSLEIVSEKLREQPDSRHAYITLWDTGRDLVERSGHPCFVSVFFRRFEGKLTLTATFRTHNAVDAWLKNTYGLIAIQRFVAERAEMEPGPLTVISHSISIASSEIDRAKAIANAKQTDMVVDRLTGKRSLRFDPNGSIKITVDEYTEELVVEHIHDNVTIGQYRAKTAQEMEQQLARDCVVSDIRHAFYVGREIAKAEMRLRGRSGRKDDPA